jgi:peptidoglycan/LPS O-acetylase OafA/YrhL
LDGLRGIAAVGVMIFHFNYFFLPQAALASMLPFMRPILVRAYLGVDLFFLVSGFVMAHVYGQKLASNWRAHWRDFAIMRFARIYPLFALTTLVMVVTHALAHLPLSGISFSSQSLVLQPLLLQEWDGDLSWNYPSWSLSSEAAAYAFFVFSAATLVSGRYPRLIAVLCVATLGALFITHGGWLNLFVGVPALLRAISEFSLGALLYRSHLAAKSSSGILPALLAVVCVVFAALTRWDVAIVGVLGCLVYYGANPTSFLARMLNSAPAIAVGAWSYSIFLWHAPAHYAVAAVFSAFGHPTQTLDVTAARLLMMATMLGVVCLSALTFNCFEVPARRLIRRTLLHTKRSTDTTIAAEATGAAGEPRRRVLNPKLSTPIEAPALTRIPREGEVDLRRQASITSRDRQSGTHSQPH